MPMHKQMLTITEVAKRLGMHPVSVYRMVKEARLPAFRIGRLLRFDRDQIENWVRMHQRRARQR